MNRGTERILQRSVWARFLAVSAVFVLVASSVFVVGLITARGSPSSSAASPSPSASAATRHDLYIGTVDLTLQTLNPLQYTLVDEYYVLGNVYSFLINYDDNWVAEPDLAVTWKMTGVNPTSYEFQLAHNAYFVDPRECTVDSGSTRIASCLTTHPVTSADVKFTYDYVKKNRNQTSYFATLSESIKSVQILGTYGVNVTFDGPYPPAMATFTGIPILPKYIWSPGGSDVKVDWTNALPIGSGPYMVRPSGTSFAMVTPPPLIFDRNPMWHGYEVQGRPVFTDTMYYESYTTSAAMAVDLTLGKIDFALGPSPQDYTTYLSNKDGVFRQALYDGFEAEQAVNVLSNQMRAYFAATTNRPVNLGSTNPVLLNQTVRTAIHMATDRAKMINNALVGLGMPGDTLMPASVPTHYPMPPFSTDDKNGDGSPYDFPPFDPIAEEQFPDGPDALPIARQMLKDAGWKFVCSTGQLETGVEYPLCRSSTGQVGGRMEDPLVFRFSTFNTEPWWETAARGVIEDAAKVGIQFNLELLNSSQMYNLWNRLDYDVWLWDWVWTPVTDISTFMIVQTCKGIGTLDNDNGFCLVDSSGKWTFDELYNKTLTETNPVARKALSDQMNAIIYGYAAYNLPFYKADTYAYNMIRWTNWLDFNTHRALPPDDGNTPILGQVLHPVSEKPPEFDLSDFEGVAGQPVQFSVAAVDPQGGTLSYRWDFDTSAEGGSSSIVVNTDSIPYNDDQGGNTATPSFTYNTPGTYGISLRVSEAGGNQFFTVKRAHVTIYGASTGAPRITVMSFSPTDPTSAAGDPVTLAASVVDPAGLPIVQYTWHWGDGTADTVTTTPTATHQYTTASTYTVELTVKNSADATGSASKVVPVAANVAPVVAPLQDAAVVVNTNNTFVAFASDANARDLLSYSWTFGDGGTMTGNPVWHIYSTQNRQYTMTVTVSDGHGHSASSSSTINVVADRNTAPKINSFTLSPTSPYTTQVVTFTANVVDNEGNPLHWQWDLDGNGVNDADYTTPLSVPGATVIQTQTHQFTSQGTYKAQLTVTDEPATGNARTVKTSLTFTVYANNRPTLTDILLSPTSGPPGSPFTFSSTAHDVDGDRLTYTWDFGDGTPVVTGQTTYFGATLTQTHIYTTEDQFVAILVVEDGKGGEARTSVLVTVSTGADTTPPGTTSAVSGTQGGGGWYRSAVTVTLTASDQSGVGWTNYSLDDGAWTPYTGTAISISGEGTHTLQYNSTDVLGNAEAPHTLLVKIDTAAPVTTADLAGTLSGSWYTTAVTVTLTPVDPSSGVESAWYRLDGGAWTNYVAPFAVSSEGAHTLAYNATDIAGNREATNTESFSVDATGPTTTATPTGTSGSSGWYVSSVSVVLAAADAGSGVASIDYRIDGGTWATYSAPFTITADGTHTLDYNATDLLGNAEATKTATIRIDTGAPVTAATLGGTLSGTWYTTAVTVSLTIADPTSGAGSARYRLDGGAWQTYTGLVTVSAQGSHSVEYNATDAAGNSEAVKSSTFQIDSVAPTATMTPTGTAGSNGWYKSAVSVSAAGSDATSGVAKLEYRIDNGAWQTYSTSFSVGEGSHSVDVRATDNAGLVSALQSAEIKVDATAPVISNLAPSGTVSSPVTVTWTGSDTTSGVANYTVSVDGGAATTVGTTASTTLVLAAGTHNVTVTAIDFAGNSASSSVQLTVSGGGGGGLDTLTIGAIVVVVAAAALGGAWFVLRRRRLSPPSEPPAMPPEP